MSKFIFSTGIPTELVGSLPRPQYLQQALAKLDAGKISYDEVKALQDKAVKETIKELEKTGSPIISDGEQRKSSFATYPLVTTLGGFKPNEALSFEGGQKFAKFDDGHERQLPVLTKGPFKYSQYSFESTSKTKGIASLPIKEAVISPSFLSLLYPVDKKLDQYSKVEFENDLVSECVKDIKKAFDAGASRVSIDFTEGRLAFKNDATNPWTTQNKISHFVKLINKVLDQFDNDTRANIGVHTCPGGDQDSAHSAEVDYSLLFPQLLKLNAGYFLIQCASEKNKEKIYQDIAKNLRKDANGIKQVAFIGVINTLNPKIETPEEIKKQLLLAAKYIPKDQIGSTDDCGFSPFSIDNKPSHNGADKAREIAFKKITNRVKGTKLAAKELGLL